MADFGGMGTDLELPDYGPAMSELTDKQRGFVFALLEFPGISFAEAARRAGYSDSSEAAKVTGHRLAHSANVQAAMREEAAKRLNASSLMAANVLMSILTDDAAKTPDKIKAAGMLLDRSGFGAAQTINVNKSVSDTSGQAIMEKIASLARKHNLDANALLGRQTAQVVDAEFVEVKDGE